jgi:hypothetical protein
MAATVNINRLTGNITYTPVNGINTRAQASDDHSTAGTDSPIKIPSAGNNYSYWVTTQLEVIGGLVGTIDNLRWFADFVSDSGVTVIGQSATAYVQATGTEGETGTQLTQGNHAGLSAAPVSVTTFTSFSPKSLTGTITASTGVFGDMFVYQYVIAASANLGATSTSTFSWQYDET